MRFREFLKFINYLEKLEIQIWKNIKFLDLFKSFYPSSTLKTYIWKSMKLFQLSNVIKRGNFRLDLIIVRTTTKLRSLYDIWQKHRQIDLISLFITGIHPTPRKNENGTSRYVCLYKRKCGLIKIFGEMFHRLCLLSDRFIVNHYEPRMINETITSAIRTILDIYCLLQSQDPTLFR